jgi:hypothetical protein
MVQAMLGDRSEDQAGDLSASAGPHDEQRRSLARFDEDVPGEAVNVLSLRHHARLEIVDAGKCFAHACCCVPLIGLKGYDNPTGIGGYFVRADDVKQSPPSCCLVGSELYGLVCTFGTVDPHDDPELALRAACC